MSAPSPKFAAGERCYLLGGRECIYVAETADGHVVRRVIEIERGDGEIAEVEADLEHAPAVYARPPKAKLDEEVARLNALIDERGRELNKLCVAIRDTQRDTTALRAKLSQHEALKYIDDFLEGRFEWVVWCDYQLPRVMRRQDALAVDGYPRETKLLSLYGSSRGDLLWRVNAYHDGSGSKADVYLCKTEAEAIAKRQALFDASVAEWREQRKSRPDAWSACCSWAQSKGASEALTIPDDLATCVRERSLKSALEDLGRAEAEVEKKRAVVAALRGTA